VWYVGFQANNVFGHGKFSLTHDSRLTGRTLNVQAGGTLARCESKCPSLLNNCIRFSSSRLLQTDCLATHNSPTFGKRFELRRTFGEGACDRLTIIARTFDMFSSSILLLHSLYTSESNLFDVNLYVYMFFLFLYCSISSDFSSSQIYRKRFSAASIIHLTKVYLWSVSVNRLIYILKLINQDFVAPSVHLIVHWQDAIFKQRFFVSGPLLPNRPNIPRTDPQTPQQRKLTTSVHLEGIKTSMPNNLSLSLIAQHLVSRLTLQNTWDDWKVHLIHWILQGYDSIFCAGTGYGKRWWGIL